MLTISQGDCGCDVSVGGNAGAGVDVGGSNVEGTEDVGGNDFSTEAVGRVPAADCDYDSRPDSQATRTPSASASKNAANNRVVKPM